MTLPVPHPATTKDTNTMTETTVYASKGGTAFHNTPDCRARWAGRDLNDWDVNDKGRNWVPGCRALNTYPIGPMTIPAAMGAGKLPCLVCMPDLGASWYQTPCEDDFGHWPTRGISERGLADDVCQRCTVPGVWWGDVAELRPVHVLWPCTSAVVLGLVPRPAAA